MIDARTCNDVDTDRVVYPPARHWPVPVGFVCLSAYSIVVPRGSVWCHLTQKSLLGRVLRHDLIKSHLIPEIWLHDVRWWIWVVSQVPLLWHDTNSLSHVVRVIGPKRLQRKGDLLYCPWELLCVPCVSTHRSRSYMKDLLPVPLLLMIYTYGNVYLVSSVWKLATWDGEIEATRYA